MSQVNIKNSLAERRGYASLFAALGDETRLSLVTRLSEGEQRSITQLTIGLNLTRQAVTKHLKVLENVGIVQSTPSGRETLFKLSALPFKDIQAYLEFVSNQWDQNLKRLKAFVEH